MTSNGQSGRADLGPKLDLRRKNRQRVRRKRGIIVILVAVLLALAGWLALFSPVLETREVSVTGTELTSVDEVTQAAQVPIGTPLTRLPSDAIRQRLLALPEVADVKLHRNWPHTLEIEIIERTMVYQRVNGDGYQWVDATGKIFHTSAEPAEGITATIDSDEQRMLADVATVVQALPADVAGQVTRVTAATLDHIVLDLADGRQIVWGNAEQSSQKAALLPVLLAQPGTVYDVSAPGHPAIR